MADEREQLLVARYDAHAVAYQALWAPTLRLASAQLLRALARKPVGRIVDIGTGVGTLWLDVRGVFPDAFFLGLDRSPGMLRMAPVEMARAVADARALPLQSASVDLALFVFMLFHLADPIQGIKEARRVVRPGGFVGTVTWGSDLASPATAIWTECLNEYGAGPTNPITQPRDDLLDTPEKMDALLRAGGFERVRAWADDLVATISLEHLLELRTRMGNEKARFDSLDEATRATCVEKARARLRRLASSNFVATGRIIYAMAS